MLGVLTSMPILRGGGLHTNRTPIPERNMPTRIVMLNVGLRRLRRGSYYLYWGTLSLQLYNILRITRHLINKIPVP